MTADYRRACKHRRGDTDTYQIFHLDTFSSGCFGKPFTASFKRIGNTALANQGPCFITLAQLCSMTQSPAFWGALICAPELGTGTAAGNAIEAPNLLNSRHQGTVRTPQIPVPQVGHRQCLSLQLNKFYLDLSLLDSATAFPIYHSFHSSRTKKSSHTSQKN